MDRPCEGVRLVGEQRENWITMEQNRRCVGGGGGGGERLSMEDRPCERRVARLLSGHAKTGGRAKI